MTGSAYPAVTSPGDIAGGAALPEYTPPPAQEAPGPRIRFNFEDAERAGYSVGEVVQRLAPRVGFNLEEARRAGYSDREIYDRFRGRYGVARAPSPVETARDIGRGVAENLYGLGRGAVAGALGAPGAIEEFGAYTLPSWLGFRPQEQEFAGRRTLFPTPQEVSSGLAAIGIAPATGRGAGFETAGEVIGGLATPQTLTRAARAIGGVRRVAAESTVGRVAPETEQLARQAEQAGYRLEPGQLRAEAPMTSPGLGANAQRNQLLANRRVSEAMGQRADRITPEYLRERAEYFRREYSDIFIGPNPISPRMFQLDLASLYNLERIAAMETRLAAGGVPGARSIASELFERFSQLPLSARTRGLMVDGEELWRLRTELNRIQRTVSDRVDAAVAQNAVEALNGSIRRTDSALARRLEVLDPQYRAFSTVRQVRPERGNIDLQQLGDYLARTDRRFIQGTSTNPLAQDAQFGRDLRISSEGRPATRVTGNVDIPLGRFERILGYGLRTQPARALQRAATRQPAQQPTRPLLGLPNPPGRTIEGEQ